MLSHSVEYALRATLHIAGVYPGTARVGEIAERVGAPPTYLAKILGTLARAGILESSRGRAGGFRLTQEPATLSLAEIVAAVEGAEERRCLLGQGRCGDNPDCTVHVRWAPIARDVDAFFGKTTLADLLPPVRTLT